MSSPNLSDFSLPISQYSTECEDITERMPVSQSGRNQVSGAANRSLNWCFTINNPCQNIIHNRTCTDPSIGIITSSSSPWINVPPFFKPSGLRFQIKTCVWQLERGSSGTLHLQGYMEMKSSQRFTTMRDCFGGRAHLEKRKGTRLQAIAYCAKKDNGIRQEDLEAFDNDVGPWFYSSKEPPETLEELLKKAEAGQETRSEKKFKKLVESVKQGDDDLQLTEKYGPLYAKNMFFVDRLRLRLTPPRSWKTDVIIIQGPSGCGKSKWCYDQFGYNQVYPKPVGDWWDNYDRHEVVLLDDFYGGFRWTFFLQLLDRYPLLVPIKSAFRQFVGKTIVITTNGIPCKWYKFNYAQIARRVKEYRVWNTETQSFDVFDNSLSNCDEDNMRVYLTAYNHMTDYHNKQVTSS